MSEQTTADSSGMTLHKSIEAVPASVTPQFVRITSEGSVLRGTMIGPSIKEREAEIIDRELTEAIQQAGRNIETLVLDLSYVATLSSIGLGMCIDVRNAAERKKMRTIITGLNRELRDLFRMMRIDRLFICAHDEDEVRSLLRG